MLCAYACLVGTHVIHVCTHTYRYKIVWMLKYPHASQVVGEEEVTANEIWCRSVSHGGSAHLPAELHSCMLVFAGEHCKQSVG